MFTDLIVHLNDYTNIDPKLSKQLFDNSLYHDIIESKYYTIIVLGENNDANAFIYDYDIIPTGIDNRCFNCKCGIDYFPLLLAQGKCRLCRGVVQLISINNTGVPNGCSCLSKFYIYNSNNSSKSILFVIQKWGIKTIIHKFYSCEFLDTWVILKCRRNSFIILAILQFELLPELKHYIMLFLI